VVGSICATGPRDPESEFEAERESGSVSTEEAVRLANRNMIAFDLALGSGALLAPTATLRVLGHDAPSPDARHLFQRCGPIWLTFAAAHAIADRRGEAQDWWALAWLRATELATDAVWSRSPAFTRPSARRALWLAGAGNLAMALAFAWLARELGTRRRGRLGLRRR
jgi:hypothetical protein